MREVLQLKEYCEEIGCKYLLDEPMKNHTTFKIGGLAEIFIEPHDIEQISKVLSKAKSLDIEIIVIGNGSDLLVKDDGIKGAVICLSDEFAEVKKVGDKALYCTAGTRLSHLCYNAYNNRLSGLEFAWGIPANVGGAVYMNAGAYGGEIKDVLTKVWYLNEKFELTEITAENLDMTYRHSFFTNKSYVIVAALFTLQEGEQAAIKEKMDKLMASRKEKQPLEYPSGGSTFKRPAGAYAAALIDECGLKGFTFGGAMVSKKHAGFVINYNNATCNDVLTLIKFVQEKVKEQTGYELECEVKII